jgi:hypothetical protein
MIEYPSIINSSKAPRKPCIAFDKLDGNNIRVKWTQKRGFHLFGSRTQLIDKTHETMGGVVDCFFKTHAEVMDKIIRREFPNEREVIAFGEYVGDKSFAGMHDPSDPTLRFVLFDLFVGHKNPKFLTPQEFVKMFDQKVETPKVIYKGNLSDQLIKDVREGKYGVNEGVICKGTERSGAYRGNVWMAKIKTQAYLERVFARYGQEGLEKFGE